VFLCSRELLSALKRWSERTDVSPQETELAKQVYAARILAVMLE